MTKFGIKALTVTAALALAAPAPSWAMSRQAVNLGIANSTVAQHLADAGDAAADDAGGLSDVTQQGIGCLVTMGAALGYTAFAAGAAETLMVAAGGLTVASSSSTLWLGLTSTMAAATCSLGAAAQPAIGWAYEQRDNIAANFAYQMKAVGTEVASLTNGVMSALFAAAPAVSGPHQVAERVEAGR